MCTLNMTPHRFEGVQAVFWQEFHESRGDMQIRLSAWSRHTALGHVRELSFVSPIKVSLHLMCHLSHCQVAVFGDCCMLAQLRGPQSGISPMMCVQRSISERTETYLCVMPLPYITVSSQHFCAHVKALAISSHFHMHGSLVYGVQALACMVVEPHNQHYNLWDQTCVFDLICIDGCCCCCC